MKAYKLVRKMKDNSIAPLFINATMRFAFNEWLQAECHPKKGFAVRQGWHCCFKPYAPHLKENLKSGGKRVWIEVEVDDYEEFERTDHYGGNWILAQKMKVIKELSFEEVTEILNSPIDTKSI